MHFHCGEGKSSSNSEVARVHPDLGDYVYSAEVLADPGESRGVMTMDRSGP